VWNPGFISKKDFMKPPYIPVAHANANAGVARLLAWQTLPPNSVMPDSKGFREGKN
jgi:hypothetical protein